MQTLLGATFFFHFVINSDGHRNNVCSTFKDYYTLKDNPNCWYDVAADSVVPEVIVQSGYAVEIHQVETADRYILTMFRIPQSDEKSKGPVLLQHGWLGSSANFVGNGKDSLAFLLADYGYDVWLGNYRGTEYSEEHVNLTVHDSEYWDYTIEDLGVYDTPTMLDYVTELTGQKQRIVYIGHSLGTTGALVYASSLPQHAKKTVQLFIMLAPAAGISHVKSPFFRVSAPVSNLLVKIAWNYDLMRLLSQAKILKSVSQQICLESPVIMQLCANVINVFGPGPLTQTGPSKLPVQLNQSPGGVSFNIFKQLGDMVKGYFRHYDYGKGNVEKYGSPYPPEYNLNDIEVPVYLVYSVSDWIITEKDTLILYSRLPAKVTVYGLLRIGSRNFNHNDFLYGETAKSIVYDRILELLQKI